MLCKTLYYFINLDTCNKELWTLDLAHLSTPSLFHLTLSNVDTLKEYFTPKMFLFFLLLTTHATETTLIDSGWRPKCIWVTTKNSLVKHIFKYYLRKRLNILFFFFHFIRLAECEISDDEIRCGDDMPKIFIWTETQRIYVVYQVIVIELKV